MEYSKKTKAAAIFLGGFFVAAPAVIAAPNDNQNQSDVPALFAPAALPQEHIVLPDTAGSRDTVFVDFGLLDALMPGAKLRFNAFADADYVGTVGRIERRGPRNYSIFGQIDGVEHGQFRVVVYEDVVSAFIDAAMARNRLRVRYAGGTDVYYVYRIEGSKFPPCGQDHAVDPTGERFRKPLSEQESQTDEETEGQSGDDDGLRGDEACGKPSAIWDVGVIFTTKTKNALGGTNQTLAEIQLAVDGANDSYANSNVSGRMRFLYAGETGYDEDGTYEDHRDRLTDPDDGFFDWAHDRRNTYALDMMSVWVTGGTDSWCGMANCKADDTTSFQSTNYDCAVSNFTYHHEHGHNQGCAHNEGDAGSCPWYSYSYGWRWFGNSGQGWRSVMAYNNDAEDYDRINWWSNPNINYDGKPTGKADEAENARTLNNRARTAENWRQNLFDIWVDFPFNGTELGTFDNPFDTVSQGVNKCFNGESYGVVPTVWIKTGSTSETPTINKRVFIRACGGTVRIGG